MTPTSPTTIQPNIPGISDRLQFTDVSRERLPTNTTANRHAIHRWFNFIAGFSPEFVAQQNLQSVGSMLLDPFAGCGTSLVVAQSLGHRAVGFEPHPFFVRIARAKTGVIPPIAQLQRIETALLDGIKTPEKAAKLTESAETFLVKLFDEHVLRQLLGARTSLEQNGMHHDDLAFLLLSRVIEMCSKAQTDGIYKAPTSTKKAALPTDAVRTVVAQVRQDAAQTDRRGHLPHAILYESTSEDMSIIQTGSVNIVVTSPPYLNNFDFAEMTRMHLYFWGMCGSWSEITKTVRSKLIVNTTTALSGQRDIQSLYRHRIAGALLPELDSVVTALASERRLRAGKKEYDLLVYPYFAQMTNVLLEVQRCLAVGGSAHIVIADAAFYGIHVSTPQLIASAMSAMGFVGVQCIKLRDRGHRWVLGKRDGSPIGLGEYHIIATKEILT